MTKTSRSRSSNTWRPCSIRSASTIPTGRPTLVWWLRACTPPTDGDPIEFTTYFEAEIEIEIPLAPPLEVTADWLSRAITVRLDPAQWITRADGAVWDLDEFNYNTTEQLFELDAEFGDGVADIETSASEGNDD